MQFFLIRWIIKFFSSWYKKSRETMPAWEHEYRGYLSRLNDWNFVFYNDEELKTNLFLEEDIFPFLPDNVEVVSVQNDRVLSNHPETIIRLMLNNAQNLETLPHLIKIRDGIAYDLAIHTEVVKYANRLEKANELLFKIYHFFELVNIPVEKNIE